MFQYYKNKEKEKMKNKKIGKLFFGLGASLAIAAPMVVAVSSGQNSTIGQSSGFADIKNRSIDDNLDISKNDINTLYYYVQHRDELLAKVSENYETLVAMYDASPVANEWTNMYMENKYIDIDSSINALDELDIDFSLKLFMLENLLERVDVNRLESTFNRSSNPTSRSLMYPEIVPNIDPNSTLNTMHGTINQLEFDANRYYLSNVSISGPNVPGNPDPTPWDINESKGDIDLITGQYYSILLNTLPNKGWVNTDADASWTGKRVIFTFIDKDTGRTDSFKLLYNTARDTNGNNEDYTFVAIEPMDASHITTDIKGQRVPSLFGLPVSFNEVPTFHYVNAHQDNAYIISGHETDPGDDNNAGNVLAGIPISPAPVLNLLNGRHSLNMIAADLINQVMERDNYDATRYNNSYYMHYLNSSMLLDGNPRDVEYLKNQQGNRIYNAGSDAFANDVSNPDHTYTTTMHWKSQTVVDLVNGYIFNELKNIMRTYYTEIKNYASGSINLVTLDSRLTTLQNTSNAFITKLNNLEFPSFTNGTFIGFLINFVKNTNFSQSENWINNLYIHPLDLHSSILTVKVLNDMHITNILTKTTRTNQDIVDLANFAINTLNSLTIHGYTSSIGSHTFTNGGSEWNTEMASNIYTMSRIAEHYTNHYTTGITWKIVDTATSLPIFYVKSETSSDSSYKWLRWLNTAPGKFTIELPTTW